MRPILTTPRVLRTGQPLTLEGIKQVCPAVFVEGPHDTRGPKYKYVPTIRPLEALMANGWGVYEASQQKATKDKSRNGFTKHMLRMRKLGDFEANARLDGVPEVILINSHDATSAYHVKAGYFRFVCSNGLIVGNQLAGFKVLHTISKNTADDILGASEKIVTEIFPRMLENIQRFKTYMLPKSAAEKLADHAMNLRYPQIAVRPFPASDLLACRREEDRDETLWSMLNRIQENILDGGWETKSNLGRTSRVRPVERVSAVASINAGLWDMAAQLVTEIA